VPTKKILGITNVKGITGRKGKYDSRSAGAGKVGQSVPQPVKGVAHTLPRKGVNRHDGSPNDKMKPSAGNRPSNILIAYRGCQKNVPLFERFFYNHLYCPSVLRNFLLKSGINTVAAQLSPIYRGIGLAPSLLIFS
jgi:hypothetical protein